MPLANNDKEKYSIDEMMGHLKKTPTAEPVLVTRADGSQAIKVQKRKRRTDQAASNGNTSQKRMQIIQIVGAVLLLVSVILVSGVSFLYVNSTAYRDSLNSKLEIASGADVEMRQFRMNPVAANTNFTMLSWPAGNVLDKLELIDVTAKISPRTFVSPTFQGQEVIASSGRLSFKASDSTKQARHVPISKAGLPVKFSRYSVPSLDIYFGNFGGLTKTEASLFPSIISGKSEIRFSGGILQLIGWPSMALDRSYIKVSNSELQIQNMRFLLPSSHKQSLGGSINFSGSFSPLDVKGTHTLSAKLENFSLSDLMGEDLGQFFLGRMDSKEMPGSNFLSFDLDSPKNTTLELTVTNSMGSRVDLSKFKFLQMLSVALDDTWYERPIFDDGITMVVKKMGSNTHISELNLVERGRMIVRGNIASGEGGAIKGKLKIGIPESLVTASGDKKLTKMFGQVSEGYRWVNLEVSGTGARLEDDFRTIYMDTSSGEISAPVPETRTDSFDDLIGE